jgi:hypothetical protein
MQEPELESLGDARPKRRKRSRRRITLSKRHIVILWVLGSILTVGLLASAVLLPKGSGPPPTVMARLVAERAIAGRMAGVVVNFSPPEWTRVEVLGGNKYSVSGWLNAASQSGRTSRSFTYSSKVSRDGNTWIAESLDLLPQ